MPSPKPITAIFDIGKSNKKFLLFDENYGVVEKYQTKLEQTMDDDGDPCEDLEKITTWVNDQFHDASKKYEIRYLNISAYGATLVHLDQNGKPVTPLYNYLKEYPDDLLEKFYKTVKGKNFFSLKTASPPMGMLNSGLQLYWLKNRKPELFHQIAATLHLPNYLSYFFTGVKKSEVTSIGCHTGMWDFEKMKYHEWLAREGLIDLLPSPEPVTTTVTIHGDVKTGPGIHDSSAALAPYLIGMDKPFVLVSTGTWSISLNPFDSEPLNYEELERDCLCYLDIAGNQVKASRFFLGAEYSYQKKRIEDHFGVTIDHNEIKLNPLKISQRIHSDVPDEKLKLEKAYNSGPFPSRNPEQWELRSFASPLDAYHQLMLDLATIQAESIKLADGSNETKKLIITGGFSQNKVFVSLVASFFPDKEVFTSKLPDASALGAAMVLNKNLVITKGAKPRKGMPLAQSQKHSHKSHPGIASPNSGRDHNDLKQLLGLKHIKPIRDINIDQYSWNL